MKLKVEGIAQEEVLRFRHRGLDANGQSPLIRRSEGGRNPCRHCLGLIAEGSEMLVLCYRPFASIQPYAESGPIFLHAASCDRYASDRLPDWFASLDPALVRGYGADDWICYETARVVRGAELTAACESILDNPEVAYVHVRSKYNCFQCRVDRA
ncbi:MAG: DUF1203 domain-containing protein [Dokdonella sp.]|uniref:DUF1203 domain-containing protein n=1 Tax=Dokdonella sp. TaxID=2291710 RepID=UPI002BF63F2C|nr:DUF1203 domain-containing protein [Dokdonella sp.]HOX70804.1 DUF1203 domain-containing protein [Dokdonella sp.]